LALIPLLTLLLDQSGRFGLALLVLLISGISLLNFNLTLILFIATFFVNILFEWGAPSEFYALFLTAAFLINFRFTMAEFSNKIAVYYLLFIVLILPSFSNYSQLLNVIISLKLISFFLVFTIIGVVAADTRKIILILNTFLILSFLNALHLIYMAVSSGARVFGFAGIMYVDYAGIAIIISLYFFIYQEKRRWINFILFLTIALALILTQTRNAWITSGLAVSLILTQFFISGKKYSSVKINKYLLICMMSVAAIIISYQAITFNPKTFERFQTAEQVGSRGIDQMSEINTLVTRVLIWHTAWNAFKSSPYIGVGLYNFQFVSGNYYTINEVLYKEFVEGLSPHQTFLEILTETGILGFTGFIIFLGALIIFAVQNIRRSRNKEEKFYSNLVFWLMFFILSSMMMTDAWLSGHGLMLWGVVVGLIISLQKPFHRTLRVEI